jgi:glycosyltransferase involved in cell wall biosynthesis
MKQRPQGIAEAFAKSGYVVIYGTLNKQTDSVEMLEEISANVYLLNENYFNYLGEIFGAQEIIYFCMWPNNIKHVNTLPHSFLIYDVMDELELLDLDTKVRERQHEDLLNISDLITVSSDNLLANIPNEYREKVLLVNNGVSSEFINLVQKDSAIPYELKDLQKSTVVGYYGAIAEWMDFDLLEFLLQECQNIFFVIIGPISQNVSSRIEFLINTNKNILVLPEKKHLDLIPYLNRFDVCMIPFVKNKLTDSISPVKLFEYFASEKPVISTAINEVYKYDDIYIANNHEEFSNAIYLAIENKDKRKNQMTTALENTWEFRVKEIEKYITL